MRLPIICLALLTALSLTAEPLANLPVREVTVFKDGHAFVMHSGEVNPSAAGEVTLEHLPQPVLGTFWPFSSDPERRLVSVRASLRETTHTQPARDFAQMLRANIGKRVVIHEAGEEGQRYAATIVDVPLRGADPDAEAEAWASAEAPTGQVLLDVGDGIRLLPIGVIRDLTFADAPATEITLPHRRHLLTLQLAGEGEGPVEVGIAYLQRGLRWIPNYRVTLNDDGTARVQLQATLINELADLQAATLRLVIGVPSFAFQDSPDPIAFQQTVATIQRAQPADQRTLYLSNAIMTQSLQQSYHSPAQPGAGATMLDLGPQVGGGESTDDLYVFTLDAVTLAKGERMVLPVSEFTVPYEHVYTLDLPARPPRELYRNFNQQQYQHLMRSPTAMHVARLTNDSEQPFTTAPALVFEADRLISQGMMRYTQRGAAVDLPMTSAINIRVEHDHHITKTTPNALTFNSSHYAKLELTGTITLTNYLDKPVRLELRRVVFGKLDSAPGTDDLRQLDSHPTGALHTQEDPYWWYTQHWNWWWASLNGFGVAAWKLELEPKEKQELTYAWHYFWR